MSIEKNHANEILPGRNLIRLGRREFLGLCALAVGATIAPVLFDDSVLKNIQAGMARPYPEPLKNEEIYLREDVVLDAYRVFFEGREEFLQLNSWWRGKGRGSLVYNLANLGKQYFAASEREGKDFGEYFKEFLGKLKKSAGDCGLDFVVFASSLQVSGENTATIRDQKVDVTISQIQTIGFGLARYYGAEYSLLETLHPESRLMVFQKSIARAIDRLKGRRTFISGPGEQHDYNALARFRAEVTTGLMDFEPSMRAKAFKALENKPLKNILENDYPQVAERYKNILEQRLGLESARTGLELEVDKFLESPPIDLANLFTNSEFLRNLGILIPFKPWQKYNYTPVWRNLVRHFVIADTDFGEKVIVEDILKEINQQKNRDSRKFVKEFISHQILNPHFLDLLQRQGLIDLNKITGSRNEFLRGIDRYRDVCLEAAIVEGPLEYDQRFQVLTSAMVTKLLSLQAGEYDPSDKNSLYWHIFKLVSIRELAHPAIILEGSRFARNVVVDPPYAPEKTINELNNFANLISEKGMIKKPPQEDMKSFLDALYSVIVGNFSKYSNLSEFDKDEVQGYCKNFVRETYHTAVNRALIVTGNLVEPYKDLGMLYFT